MLKKLKKTHYGKIILQTTHTYYFKRLLSYPKLFCKFFENRTPKQQRFSHKLKASAKIFKRSSLANIINYPIKPFSSSTPEVLKLFETSPPFDDANKICAPPDTKSTNIERRTIYRQLTFISGTDVAAF